MPQPEVLLLDEPFSALDAFTRRDLQDHLLDLWADTWPTLILVTMTSTRPSCWPPCAGDAASTGRPRDRNSPLFDNFKRSVLTSLDRSVPDRDATLGPDQAMWW